MIRGSVAYITSNVDSLRGLICLAHDSDLGGFHLIALTEWGAALEALENIRTQLLDRERQCAEVVK